jgi:hypothetical protein
MTTRPMDSRVRGNDGSPVCDQKKLNLTVLASPPDNWPLLHRLWERALKPAGQPSANSAADYYEEMKALYSFGIANEDALKLLYRERPSLEGFTSWITERTRPGAPKTARRQEDILSAEDLDFWNENGYLILRGAVPRQQCIDAQSAIWHYLGASPDDPASWYLRHEGKQGMMLQFSDHPALDANRHNSRIRHAYEQLYGSEGIFKTIDKVSFNPPETDAYSFLGSQLHWDVSLRLPIPLKLQGLLYLNDCQADDGAFHCVPGFHKRIAQWLKEVPQGVNAREWATHSLTPTAVTGEAGDFIIWHQALPHCASPNRGRRPRMVQYLTYLPEQYVDQTKWI